MMVLKNQNFIIAYIVDHSAVKLQNQQKMYMHSFAPEFA